VAVAVVVAVIGSVVWLVCMVLSPGSVATPSPPSTAGVGATGN